MVNKIPLKIKINPEILTLIEEIREAREDTSIDDTAHFCCLVGLNTILSLKEKVK